MRDHVVTLRRTVATPQALTAVSQADVYLRLFARAPLGRWRLRLWDAEGRNPADAVPQGQPLKFEEIYDPEAFPLNAPDGFDGRTLTWVVRLQGSGPYSVRLSVLQGGDIVPGGDFVYSGRLDGTEEISDRFHFKIADR